uniref:LacI family transcriptional regulator n=2 Tax=Candidatus Caldatribacterium saccharofermentans TaxID=1454753 RepID=A0A7V4WL74_9BACT
MVKGTRVTMREVAERADVSVATVSHVLNRTRFVSRETQQRVLKAIRELNYRPNVLAKSVRRRRTNTVGVVMCDLENPFMMEMLRGVEVVLTSNGFDMLVTNTNYSEEREQSALEMFYGKQVDGIILVPGKGGGVDLQLLVDFGVPVVVLDKQVDHGGVDLVEVTNREGSRELVRHLLRLGHRRIGIIAGPQDTSTGRERLLGALEAAKEEGIPGEKLLVFEGDFFKESGVQAVREFLSLPFPPSVIFACNYSMGIGAFEAIKDLGLRIPGDIGFAIFDDLPWFAYLSPPLTAVSQPAFEVGKVGAELLMERLKKKRNTPKRVVLPTSLRIRYSAGERW